MISPGGVRHEVAVKVLHEGLDPSSQAVQRLRDEGRMLGVLRHPAILRVHDLVILAGRVALVTEFIDGGDLDRCFKAGDMTLRPLVEIIGQVAAALDAAWAHPAPGGGELHLVHRDVKPANIRVGRHGEVKLLDFGIAKAAGVKREARTEAKTVVGSYLYMSPERLMRKDSSGPQGDVYSLGAVLYEGLARRRLFAGVDLKDQLLMARDHRRHDRFVKDALEALHAVDPRARELALTCLYLEPAKRPTAAQIAHRCEELADDLPGANLRQWSRKRNWPTASSETGELGGRTLTESTIITDTLPADALATPAPPPKHGTMVEFLASRGPDGRPQRPHDGLPRRSGEHPRTRAAAGTQEAGHQDEDPSGSAHRPVPAAAAAQSGQPGAHPAHPRRAGETPGATVVAVGAGTGRPGRSGGDPGDGQRGRDGPAVPDERDARSASTHSGSHSAAGRGNERARTRAGSGTPDPTDTASSACSSAGSCTGSCADSDRGCPGACPETRTDRGGHPSDRGTGARTWPARRRMGRRRLGRPDRGPPGARGRPAEHRNRADRRAGSGPAARSGTDAPTG